MKKLLFFGSILFVTVMTVRWIGTRVSIPRYNNAQAQVIANNTEYPTATRTPQPTVTLVPSATIDYQQTAIVAQSTADEARRINSMATAEYVRLLNEQLAMTQVVEQQNFIIQSWTATAALTTIPLTATQQAIVNTQIPQQQQIIAAQMSATANAPTQIVAMENAVNYVKFAKVNKTAEVVGKFSISIFAIAVVVFMFRYPMQKRIEADDEQPEPIKPEPVTRIDYYKNNGTNSFSYSIPCTPDQLSELAENITQGKKTLAVNQWEGKETLFTRPVILRVRAWLRGNEFVSVAGDGQLVPTDELLNFLCSWLDKGTLPTEYEFEVPHSPEMSAPSNHAEIMDKTTISMRNHTYDNGGGGTYPDLAVDSSK